jgi:hypothetical protein
VAKSDAVKVYLKNGAVIEFEADDLNMPINETAGRLAAFGWTNPQDASARRLAGDPRASRPAGRITLPGGPTAGRPGG